jgi:hypothetical protein
MLPDLLSYRRSVYVGCPRSVRAKLYSGMNEQCSFRSVAMLREGHGSEGARLDAAFFLSTGWKSGNRLGAASGKRSAMTKKIEVQIEAKLLTGFEFLRHPDNPALGLLHLLTETEDVWVLVTRKHLLSLAELGLRHVDDLT